MTQLTCDQRIKAKLESCIEDLQTLYDLYCEDSEAYDEDLGNLYEFGLCFDYVEPGTFTDQHEGYWRYQLSWGGPSDEFRFYVTPGHYGLEPHRIEYWFLDWYDGASRTLDLKAEDGQLLLNLWEFFEPSWSTYEMAAEK